MATKEKIHYTEEKKDLIDWSGKYIIIQKIKLSINFYFNSIINFYNMNLLTN